MRQGFGERTGGEAGIRTLGRTLKALQRFSKPPPSASRPPHRDEIAKDFEDFSPNAQLLTADCAQNCAQTNPIDDQRRHSSEDIIAVRWA